MIEHRRKVFPPALILTLLVMIILNWVGMPLTTPAAPNGIISYEFAGSVQRANEILISWDEVGRVHAAFSLGFDFLFILCYVTCIGLACTWAGERLRRCSWPLGSLGTPLAWGVGLAGVLDAIENVGLSTMLLGTVSSPWPQLATACAAGKFLVITLALFYAAYGGLAWIFGRR